MSSTGGGKSKGGRGKPKSTKFVSRSSKAGLQFPIGRTACFLRPKSTPSMLPSSSGLGLTNSIKSEEEEDDNTMGGEVSSSSEGNFDLSSPETPSMMVWVSRGPYKPSASSIGVSDFTVSLLRRLEAEMCVIARIKDPNTDVGDKDPAVDSLRDEDLATCVDNETDKAKKCIVPQGSDCTVQGLAHFSRAPYFHKFRFVDKAKQSI
ncbi:hypothetical protein RJ639_017009 [Escallonia herrerae]|uniref:Uncharacterized protein n=1 Tax=Escallonia herrerae TaxID=1293975 RepID=A0AA89AM69_9ASTE|nr:hypothetical protein RJ639_017009 [Escallonia herrerae]